VNAESYREDAVISTGWMSTVIVGAGGFGREVSEYARDASGPRDAFRLKGFLDDDPSARAGLRSAPLLGALATYGAFVSSYSTLSPHAVVNGEVALDEAVFIGTSDSLRTKVAR
jgi:hypothetical protein